MLQQALLNKPFGLV